MQPSPSRRTWREVTRTKDGKSSPMPPSKHLQNNGNISSLCSGARMHSAKQHSYPPKNTCSSKPHTPPLSPPQKDSSVADTSHKPTTTSSHTDKHLSIGKSLRNTSSRLNPILLITFPFPAEKLKISNALPAKQRPVPSQKHNDTPPSSPINTTYFLQFI